jgi:alpha-L-rhamnosidase
MGYGAIWLLVPMHSCTIYDMTHFYGKAVRDFANEQRPKGGITEIAPFTG